MTEEPQGNAAVAGQLERGVRPQCRGADDACSELQPGELFFPLCGKCLPAVGVQAEDSVAKEGDTNDVEEDSDRPRVTRMAGDDTGWEHCRASHKLCLERVVYPLSHAYEKNSEATQCCWTCRKLLEEARSSQNKHSQANSHKHLVPMIKRQLLKWWGQFRRLLSV